MISVLHIKPMEFQHFVFRHEPLRWLESLMHPWLRFNYKTNKMSEFGFLICHTVAHTRPYFAYKNNEILTFEVPTSYFEPKFAVCCCLLILISYGDPHMEILIWRSSYGDPHMEKLIWRSSYRDPHMEILIWRSPYGDLNMEILI